MSLSFDDLVKRINEDIQYDKEGNPLSRGQSYLQDIKQGVWKGGLKAGGLALKTAAFAAGLPPVSTGISNIPGKIHAYFSDKNRQANLYRRNTHTINLPANTPSVSKSVNDYVKLMVLSGKLPTIKDLNTVKRYDVINALNTYFDVAISKIKLDDSSGNQIPFDIKVHTFEDLLQQESKTGSTIVSSELNALVRGLIAEGSLTNNNITFTKLVDLIESLYLNVKGFEPIRRSTRRARY